MRPIPILLLLSACGSRQAPGDDPPVILATVPADGAVDVSQQTLIRVTFDRDISESTLDFDSFVVDPQIPGSLKWGKGSQTAVFTPDASLVPGLWTVSLTDAITANGVPLEPYSFSFTVGGDVTTQPSDDVWTDGVDTVSVTVEDPDTLERTYTLDSTHPQRDGWPQQVVFQEIAGQPVLRSGSSLFDALFALAMHESRLLSVSAINDGAFDSGNNVSCDCFQTGAEWHYVWTRDTAYAVDLGLAMIDPSRAANSLAFKVSGEKGIVGGPGLQVVQDTGSGGSWPVSTDRTVWAFGANRVLAVLAGAERDAFRDLALQAVVGTAEVDREHVFDAQDGLYRGETSFLDWREQTYPQWTAGDVRHLAESKSLSTNVGHWMLLDLAARLSGEVGNPTDQARYRGWADQLAADIEANFWIPGQGYARVLPNAMDPAPLEQFDWLGTSLAALTVADPTHAGNALRSYPHAAYGPPVIWPEQQQVPIYHNRAIWPFATAYGVRAGVAVGNDAVVSRGVQSLTRGSLLNLSNMENLELLSGANWVDDGAASGPVVNSHYQLWSVAGYLGMVFDVLGVRPEADGLHIEPFIPDDIARTWLLDSEVTLHGLRWQGVSFDLVLALPADGAGPLVTASVEVDGALSASVIPPGALSDGAQIRVSLQHAAPTGETVTDVVDNGDYTWIYAPHDPAISAIADVGGQVQLTLDGSGEANVSFDIWRDGQLVESGWTGATWLDPASAALGSNSWCYAVATRWDSSGLSSQHSQPVCWWGPGADRIQEFDAYGLSASSGDWISGPTAHWSNWGDPGHVATVYGVRPNWTGPHRIQVLHANGAGPISTGITAAQKWVQVWDAADALIAEGAVAMPQSGDWSAFRESTGLDVDLSANQTYRIEISDTQNMSWLDHFSIYTGGAGGGAGVFNRANLSGLRLLPLSGADLTPNTGALAVFDGVDDVSKVGVAQQVVPGSALQPWELFGLTWDADYLYLAWVSEALDADYAPLVLYLEAATGPFSAAVPSIGFEYSLLVPELPFTPTHAVSLRTLSDDGAASGPWDGVRVPSGPSWTTTRRFARGRDSWGAADRHTLSVRIPRSTLGDPTRLRMAGHVVNAVVGSEWVDTIPPGHTPWAAGGGNYYEIDLSGATAASGWSIQ